MKTNLTSLQRILGLISTAFIGTALLGMSAMHAQASTSSNGTAGNNPAYYQDPAMHNNHLIFASQGDLWSADVSAEAPQFANRISSHIEIESDPYISPQGKQLAYVSNYNNIASVYVKPMQAGMAKQVSFESSSSKLHGWVDENTLLYSTMSEGGMHSSWVLKTVDINTLNTTTLPLSDAVEGVISDDGSTVFFTQFGLQISTDNANQYKGGASGELWRFALNQDSEATLLTGAHEGSVRSPMLYQGRLFFISNESGLDNIWSMDTDGSNLTQHTDFTDWAVTEPYMHGGKIVFQHGADIKQFDVNTNQHTTYDLRLRSDFSDLRTQYIDKPLDYLDFASVSADGEKVVVTARANMVVADTDVSRLVEVASDPSARVRHAIMSHDNRHVYAFSDQSGEYEIWQYDASGKDQSKQLTDDGSVYRTAMWLTPDGENLVHADKSGKLFILNLDSGDNDVLIDDLSSGFIDNIAFSNDSRYLSFAYSQIHSERPRILLHDLEEGKTAVLTSEKYASFSPSFGPNMQWLYFLSDRAFRASPGSPWGDRNMGQVFEDRTQIYALALQQDASFPFAAPTELSTASKETEDNDADADKEEKAAQSIDFDGLASRLWQVDVKAGNYRNLLATKEALLYLNNTQNGADLNALAYEFNAKPNTLTSGVSNIELSGSGEHLLVQKGRRGSSEFFVVPAKASFPPDTGDAQVKLNAWTLAINPKLEWQQMFKDAWLMHRDGLFDANMRGIDWQATKQKYMPLLERVSARHELNDIFKQMMGELNTLHSQVRGGDTLEDEDAPNLASLGAIYQDDKDGLKIQRIYRFDNELLEQAPPLAKPGVDALEGDIITAVNGKPIGNAAELQTALKNKSGQQVLLDIQRGRNTHQTVVVPQSLRAESRSRYQDWVVGNASAVNAQNEDIGYLHLFAMGGNDLASFAREFYAQYDKPALIIDVRRNRGGNIDSIIIEKLLRRAWSFWQTPNGENSTNMQQAFRGHLVVLADQFTYSDGETFTAGVKALDLGTVIGKQTAGAGVWLSGGNNVVDGGIARVAEFGVFDMDGNWLTEGRGISPDIEVVNYPHATFKGEDAQLDYAVKYLQEKLQSQPIKDYQALPLPSVEEAANDIQ